MSAWQGSLASALVEILVASLWSERPARGFGQTSGSGEHDRFLIWTTPPPRILCSGNEIIRCVRKSHGHESHKYHTKSTTSLGQEGDGHEPTAILIQAIDDRKESMMSAGFRISPALWERIHYFASFPQTGGVCAFT